jgi:predicted lipid-binding transport protein (Tim44 family)
MTPPYQQPSRGFGGFGGSFLGSMAGGMLGGMLFRSLGFGGGYGGGGGGGIGIFEILLLAGIGYMIYRFVKKKRADEAGNGGFGRVIKMEDYQRQDQFQQSSQQPYAQERDEIGEGLSFIRQMDPGFDEQRFNDNVMDIFFKIQGAWMNRDLSGVSNLLTDEMRRHMQGDLDTLIKEKRVNRLENIAVRTVEISEAWQESGQDFITALIYANLLDYTTDDATGAVVAGSKTEPVKFEEYWTFTRQVGNNPWKLSAINQK